MANKLKLLTEELKKKNQSLGLALSAVVALLFLGCSLFTGTVRSFSASLKAFSLYPESGIEIPKLKDIVKLGILSPSGLLISMLICILASLFLLWKYLRSYEPNPVSSQDERGVSFLEKGTYGTSRWMTEEEAAERFTTGNIKDISQTIYGQFTENGEKVVSYASKGYGGNKHVTLIGSSGSGKSFSYIRTEIIQSVLRGESVVCTDPSAELYTDLAQFAKDSGAEVKVLNLSSPQNGNGWNCVSECINPDTMSLDSGRLNDFADIYMKNASALASSDGFWAAAELNLFKAAIGLCAFQRDSALNEMYKKILTQILRYGGYSSKQIKEIKAPIKNYSPLCDVRKLIDTYAKEVGYNPQSVKNCIAEAEEKAPPFSISEVYNIVLSMDRDEDFKKKFMNIPMTHPAAVAYKTYSSQEITEKIKASARMGLLNQLQIFNDTSLKGVLSVDDLNFERIGEKQTVLFIITPDKSDTFKPISSLAFSFLFKDLSDAWDREQAAAQKENRKNNRLTVNVIMDEFYSVGAIPSFPVFIATCRKRLLNITVSLQNIGQLYDLYGDNGGDTILSCCDTLLFMGCNDLTTARFVSDFCAGEATIKSQSFKTPNGLVAALTQAPQQQVGVSESSRRLITPDEVRRFTDGILVVARGEQPLKLRRLPYTDHPAYKAGLLIKSNVYDLPPLLSVHSYKDSFSGILLKDLYSTDSPDKKSSAEKESFAIKLDEIKISSPFETPENKSENAKTTKEDEIRVQKAKYCALQEIYPTGSKSPLEIDYCNEALFTVPGTINEKRETKEIKKTINRLGEEIPDYLFGD